MNGNTAAWDDYYEVLQLNPNADQETIERIFRLLAKRYHPDNRETGDSGKFNRVREAYNVLSNPTKRAAYDVKYFENRTLQWKIFSQNGDDQEGDKRVFLAVLSLLYIARRQNCKKPGLGIIQLEELLGCPAEYLEFHVWYLKEKGWIERIENGQLAITAAGVEKVGESDLMLRADRLLEERNHRAHPQPNQPHTQPGGGNGEDPSQIPPGRGHS